MTSDSKISSGLRWLSISHFGRQLLQFLTTIILARLLSPSDFGLASMALVVIGFVTIFKDLGTSAAIIQRKHISSEVLSGIFWLNILFGLTATIILLALSPIITGLYQEPRLTAILRALSFTFIISSLSIVPQAILERDMAFGKIARIELGAILTGSSIGIGSALFGSGVWSLVYQSLTTVTLTTMLFWITHPWRPGFNWHWSEVLDVSRYSLNLTGFNIFNYFARNADYILVGTFLGAQALGYYTLAYKLVFVPLQSITAIINRTIFPLFSRLQEDDLELRRTYLHTTASVVLIVFPIMLALLVLSEQIVLVLFGTDWQPSTSLIMVFAATGAAQAIGITVGTIYQVKGRTDLLFRWGIVSSMLVTIAFVFGISWGVIGVAAGYMIATFTLLYPSLAIPFQLINLSFYELTSTLKYPVINSLITATTIFVLKTVLYPTKTPTLALGIIILLTPAIYLGMNLITNPRQIQQILAVIGVKRWRILRSQL